MLGQTNPDSAFGKALVELAKDERYKTYCEVGTWNGMGSTRCIIKGILRRQTPAEFWSYEASQEMYNQAVKVWDTQEDWLHLEFGTLHRSIPSLRQLEESPVIQSLLRSGSWGDEYKQWYNGERMSLLSAPLAKPPPSADVVILDGGEFTTQGDWDVLSKCNPSVVALDDTRIYKTNAIRAELLASPKWDVVHDVINERNGWAIFKKID